ncbi:MAG: transposase [Pseudonocardiaceae bacterium]
MIRQRNSASGEASPSGHAGCDLLSGSGGGIAWRRMPQDFPPAMTVYDLFGRWAKAGVWQRVHDALRDLVRVRAGRDLLPSAAIIDSQTVRGADTVPWASAGYDAGKKTKGRKRHIAVDTLGGAPRCRHQRPTSKTATVLTGCWWHCAPASPRVSHIWADGGYTGRLLTWARTILALTVKIVKRTDDLLLDQRGVQVDREHVVRAHAVGEQGGTVTSAGADFQILYLQVVRLTRDHLTTRRHATHIW